MSLQSEKFEKQIERIHFLLCQDDAIVTWNDKIVDPDNPNQLRQIDITIKSGNYLTMIECRFQKKKQDVKWIEELMGRRTSLRADSLIAVSSSGFTEGAIKKAIKYGVILRDTKSLTEEEIQRWGHPTKVSLKYFHYENVIIKFVMKSTSDVIFDQNTLLSEIKKENLFSTIFERVAQEILNANVPDIPIKIKVPFMIEGLNISSCDVLSIIFEADFHVIKTNLDTPSVVVYDDPRILPIERNISIEKYELDTFEITKSSNNVSVIMDLSHIKNPINTQFRSSNFNFEREMNLNYIEFVGRPNFDFGLENIILEINYLK
ncbi:MAG: restriction endonuclease [Bacteroidetes bacterium]|nr:restriction endonuclease [Bacteroidota bacterium]MBU1116992.1 restriction endonuclease [Bacteroidota bacterium]MBU1797328.1 restriction endonuclease [Bacteroidota bacterium]